MEEIKIYIKLRSMQKPKTQKQLNTHILIDYDNVYITLDKYYVRCDRMNLKSDIVTKIKEKLGENSIFETKLFLDFNKIKLTEDEFSVFKNNHVKLEHVYSGKNASDVYLMIDIIKTLSQNDNIDRFVVISSDSDILPIVNELKSRGKEIIVGYFKYNTNPDYSDYLKKIANGWFTIEDLYKMNEYVEQDLSYFNSNMKKIVEFINKDIIKVYEAHSKYNYRVRKTIYSGTYSKKNVRDLFEDSRLIVKDEISFIINKLFELEILYESPSLEGDGKYKKVLINPDFLDKNGIKLENLITETNYKDWLKESIT